MNEGYSKGDVCNRNGCDGIIDEHEKEGCCSCHINPPCGFCEADNSFCPKCDYSGAEEKSNYENDTYEKNKEYYEKQNKEFAEKRDLFYKKFRGELPIEKLEMRTESHTHFTQKVVGVFPDGTKQDEILKQVRGTFGGRFNFFDKNRFEYIAYTD